MPKRPTSKRRHWSKNIEESGVKVRVYERAASSSLWYSVTRNGKKHRKSLKTSDRKLAEERARTIARTIAELELTGGPVEKITLRRLSQLYLHHRGPLLSDRRLRFMEVTLALFCTHLGNEFTATDFSQHHADAFTKARQGGVLKPENSPIDSPGPETIRNELEALSIVFNWGCAFRAGGRPLLTFNPVRGLKLPREENPARPLATEERYRKLLGVSDEADPLGRIRCLLVLAWETGRRLSSLIHLRASDLLFTRDQVRRALAEEGQDEAWADHWPQAIRWRANNDKQGYLSFSPMTNPARDALEAHLKRRAVVGEAWLFPQDEQHPGEPMTRRLAGCRLGKAEQLAGLPHQKQGGWHAFRRAWATRRKHLPVQDVMAAGGWRDINSLQKAYQAADPETVRRVMELG